MKPPHERIYSPEELQRMVDAMQEISSQFYRAAASCGNHAFIEFAGLMNEYIKMCAATVKAGRDFTCANVHLGQPLEACAYNVEYLGEKFACVFGTTFDHYPMLAVVFATKALNLATKPAPPATLDEQRTLLGQLARGLPKAIASLPLEACATLHSAVIDAIVPQLPEDRRQNFVDDIARTWVRATEGDQF